MKISLELEDIKIDMDLKQIKYNVKIKEENGKFKSI